MESKRHIGFWGATGIGVGAMIGGGILALAGVAFAVSGPSTIFAFLINGFIAFLTVFSFSEMAVAHPQNGGIYTFSKKALSVQAAFGVGWVVWFASIVATVLYALGFGSFVLIALQQMYPAIQEMGFSPRFITAALALLALTFYTWRLSRVGGGSGVVANIGKLIVFAIIIASGLAMTVKISFSEITSSFQPFFTGGVTGVLAAMGYTFITVQGFGLITNVGGEIKNPEKNIPKAMMATVLIGLSVYIPILFVIATVGVPDGETITSISTQNPEAAVAIAVQQFMGPFGFWLVIVAGIFSMLSALEANIFAASRVAMVMAKDGTLNHQLAHVDKKTGLPTTSIYVTAVLVGLLIILLPNVAAAGAASGLIFLVSYALAHAISMLMRNRNFESTKNFRTPLYPFLPILGMLACFGLATFQAFVEPAAGLISLFWLVFGSAIFIIFFVQKARVIDASEEALHPELVKLRGLNPLVLVPIVNPDNAESKIFLANSLAPPRYGRVLLLAIVLKEQENIKFEKALENNQKAMSKAIKTSVMSGLQPDTLITIADEPWNEMARVAKLHRCKSILIGLSNITELQTQKDIDNLVKAVECDVVIFRQPFSGWKISDVKKILVPVAGFAEHDLLRARILASLWRENQPMVSFVQILPTNTPTDVVAKSRKKLHSFASQIIPGKKRSRIYLDDNPKELLISLSNKSDLVILGLTAPGPNRPVLGNLPIALATDTSCGLIFINRK
ncbi:MAG: amino acid permease [Balneolaceae bacterium]|nr:MAG: amino acid permease [Balneolaceae bacterium]